MDIGRRIDRTASKIAAHFARAMFKYKGGYKPVANDFTLYPVPDEVPVASTEDEVFGFLKALGVKDGK